MGKTLKKASKCHTLILQGHMQPYVLCKVKHVVIIFASRGCCYEAVLEVVAGVWREYCSRPLDFDSANRPLRKPIFWRTGGLAAIEVHPSAKRQPVQRHLRWEGRKPRLNLDLGSLRANVPCGWNHCWSSGCSLVFIQVELWCVLLVKAWDSSGQAR